jgi:hypothetical protein
MRYEPFSLSLMIFVLAGCASNPTTKVHSTPTYSVLSRYYHPAVGALGSTHGGEPEYVSAGSQAEAQSMYDEYIHRGYHLVGYSSFSHAEVPLDLFSLSQTDIIDQAKKVHADIALYFTEPMGSKIMTVPISSNPSISAQTTVIDQNGQSVGSFQTTISPPNPWNYADRAVPLTGICVEFLAN